MKYSSTRNTNLQRCLILLFWNQQTLFPLFFEKYLYPEAKIDKVVRSVDSRPRPSTLAW